MSMIDTKTIKINKDKPEIEKVKSGAGIIKKGGVVAFPTETVYGLGANALDENSVEKIFKAKGRPADNPLIVHIAEIDQIKELVEDIPKRAEKLMKEFWPGPLTIIFNKREIVPKITTGGLSTVAIRMPNHKIALELIKESGVPIAAPSANTSSKPSPTDAEHVIEDMKGKIDMIIDGGPTGVGVESTVLDISGDIPTILRPGGITLEDLLSIFPEVNYDPALENNDEEFVPKSPGQKYRHYSPDAEMILFEGNLEDISKEIIDYSKQNIKKDKKIGIMATEQTKDKYKGEHVIVVGDRDKPETIATNLFKVLRDFDRLGVDIILAEGINENGIGKAIMNRMKKAASKGR